MAGGTEQTVRTRDGRSLSCAVVGEGEPTVVFESGLGGSRRCWGLVQREVGAQVRAVSYDRSGFGTSSADPERRTLERMAADLADVLDDLGGRPAVLVGHSWGGPIVRRLAEARPELVAAIVLVDQTDERCDLYFNPKLVAQQQRLNKVLPLLAKTGLLRLWVRSRAGSMPADLKADLLTVDGSAAGARNMAHEAESLEDDLVLLRDQPPALPPVPITWISGTKRPRIGAGQRACLVAAHQASAAAHTGDHRHVEASRSGHYVMWSEPEVVVAEILRLLPGA
jgi:pimeloyl-ACP methyl ester carboxylesterase